MRWSAFQRARRLGGPLGQRAPLYGLGVGSALLAPLLIGNFGLIVHLLAGVEGGRAAGAWGPAPWLLDRMVSWPLLGRPDFCLAALIASGVAGAAVETLLLFLLGRVVQQRVTRGAIVLRRAVAQQTQRLGAVDWLLGQSDRVEDLFVEKVERVRRGLAAWDWATAHEILLFSLLLLTALAANFWLTLLAILLALFIWRRNQRRTRRAEREGVAWRRRAATRRALLLEKLRLTATAPGCSVSGEAGEPFEEDLVQYESATLRADSIQSLASPLLWLSIVLGAAFLVLIIGLSPEITAAGSAVSAAALLGACLPARQLLSLPQVLGEADRVAADTFDYFDRQPGVRQIDGARPLPRMRRGFELDNVSLADAEGRRLLDGVSLALRVGGRAALAASDPDTPRALAGLLPRLYDPLAGRVLIDGHDVRGAALETVRVQTALLLKTGMQFTGTVEENIRCGDPAFTPQQVVDAAQKARASEFIDRLPNKMQTVIGPYGAALPPDQALRVALARALLRDPSILVIEEPAAELDETAASRIDEAIAEAAQDRTLLFIPARLSTLRTVDRVFLFHEGKLVARGGHAELVQQSELYRHLNYLRFNAFRDVLS